MAERSHSHRPRGLELRFRGPPAGARRIRRNAGRNPGARQTDARRRRSLAWFASKEPTPATCRRSIDSGIHDPGLEPFPPSRPAVTDHGQGERRSARHQGEARRQPPSAADGRRVLLLAARQRARNQSRRLLVGQSHADQPAAAAGKDGAVLARPFRRPTKPRCAITASCSASWSSSRSRAPAISGT